jgi:hypothetical protein
MLTLTHYPHFEPTSLAAPRTLAEAGYLVDNHLFLPYDMHSQPFIRQKYIYPVEEGQFDDHSDENGEKSPS